MEFALHEMYEVSGLMMGDIPYEEYIPSAKKLHLMKKDAPLVYELYWEVLCHFHICAETTGLKAEGIKQMAWAKYCKFGDAPTTESTVTAQRKQTIGSTRATRRREKEDILK